MEEIRITNCKNTNIDNVVSRKHNIWIGISLGNKYFNKEHLANYLKWAVKACRESVLVIVADELHSLNYQVFDNFDKEKAISKSLSKGEEILTTLKGLVDELTTDEKSKVKIIQWGDISSRDDYKLKLSSIEDLYRTNQDFHHKIFDIVRLNLGERTESLDENQLELLARYVILEFPIFMGALEYDHTYYDLHIYPGLSLMDDMILDIQSGTLYPELTKDIEVKNKLSIAEVYAE